MGDDSAANSVGAGGVDMPADVQQAKKKKKPVYDGRTKAGRKFVEKMLARRTAKKAAQDLTAQKTNMASVQMKEDLKEKADQDTVDMILANPKMKAKTLKGLDPKARKEVEAALKKADTARRKDYNAYQKSKR